MTIEIEALNPTIGAYVRGVDLREHLEADTIRDIRQALLDHLVLFFPDQPITAADQLRFAEYFAPAMLPTIDTRLSDVPGVTVLDQIAPKGEFTDRWHTDHTFVDAPPLGSMLHAIELPRLGGDTCFASMYAAYDALSPDMQRFIDPLVAVHSTEIVAREVRHLSHVTMGDATTVAKEAIHPVVRVHPETGRKALFVCGNFTTRVLGLTEGESQALLGYLFEHIKAPQFQCRYTWRQHSVAFWDNRSTQHCAIPDYHERRLMNRVMVAGDKPFGPISG
jgi:taurine dioxygenase